MLLREQGDRLIHPAGRDGGQQGEGLVEQEHPRGYGIDVVAVKRRKTTKWDELQRNNCMRLQLK